MIMSIACMKIHQHPFAEQHTAQKRDLINILIVEGFPGNSADAEQCQYPLKPMVAGLYCGNHIRPGSEIPVSRIPAQSTADGQKYLPG